VRFGLADENKHIIVLQGDGGATIGLQHIMEGARLNLDLKVIINNNMLYGMTGGQSSGMTPIDYRTTTDRTGSASISYDLPMLAHQAGATYTSRVIGEGSITDDLAAALSVPGFSLIEVMEYCPSYGLKYNPGERLSNILEKMGGKTGSWENERDTQYLPEMRAGLDSLFDKLPGFGNGYRHRLKKPFPVIVGGSAGEGVQTASRVLANAGMMAGLEVSKKGIYPVTVGTGFSTSEIILSPGRVEFTGINDPDAVIIVSEEGLENNRDIIAGMAGGSLVMDDSLSPPETGAEVVTRPFRSRAGRKGAALCAIAFWLKEEGIMPVDALIEVSRAVRHSESLVKSIEEGRKL
jgi:Pyruvate/2-oxoacid:ferredoxin oxidoreductase gamma subunit